MIILTKADLVNDPQNYVRKASRLAPAVPVVALNALQTESLECLGPWLSNGQTIALLGSSGVGKSTLTNTTSDKQSRRNTRLKQPDEHIK